MNSDSTPSSTFDSPTCWMVRMRLALMKIWSVNEEGRKMRQAVP